MDWKLTQEDYQNFEVAREGNDEGYGIFSGYVAVVKGNRAAIVYASHCSCYGTWDGGTYPELGGGVVEWTGTLEQLLSLARRKADTTFESLIITENDYTGTYLLALYDALLKKYQPESKEE